jgi:hypothetical protein
MQFRVDLRFQWQTAEVVSNNIINSRFVDYGWVKFFNDKAPSKEAKGVEIAL